MKGKRRRARRLRRLSGALAATALCGCGTVLTSTSVWSAEAPCTGAYYFLYVVGEPVPPHEEWMAAHPDVGARRGGPRRRHERSDSAGRT